MKFFNYIWQQYIIAFFVALFLCLVDLIVDGVASGETRFWTNVLLVFIVFSIWDLIKFIISKVKN